MCLATPVKIKKIENNRALLENGQEVDISLIDSPFPGQWLLCHADLAINKIEEKEAKIILGLVKKCHHSVLSADNKEVR